MGERLIFSPCNSVFLAAVWCTMKITLEARPTTTTTHTAHCEKLVNKKRACTCGCCHRAVPLWIGSRAIAWLSKDFKTYSCGELYPNTTKKAAGVGLARGQEPWHPSLGQLQVPLENFLHPTLQLKKLGPNGVANLPLATDSISVGNVNGSAGEMEYSVLL